MRSKPFSIHHATCAVSRGGPTLTRGVFLVPTCTCVVRLSFRTPGAKELLSDVGSSVRSGQRATIEASITSPAACRPPRAARLASLRGIATNALSTSLVSILTEKSSTLHARYVDADAGQR